MSETIPEDIRAAVAKLILDAGRRPLGFEDIASAILAERVAERERCTAICAPWMRRDHLSLHAGEVTAQEFRTVVAVVKSIKVQIASP